MKLEKLEQLCGKTLSFAVMTDALENFKSLMVKQNTLRTLLLFLPGSSPALRSSSQAARHKSAELCRKINKSHEVLSRHGTDAGSAWARVCFESLEGLCSFAMSFLLAVIGIYSKDVEDAVKGLQLMYEEAIKASLDEERCDSRHCFVTVSEA